MTEVSAALVKELREKTGAGMMDCKKALAESGGNMKDAEDYLRKKGLSAAAKKAGRVAAEGLVSVLSSGNKGVVVEINAETDFVARNDRFQAFSTKVAEVALNTSGDVEALKKAKYPGTSHTVLDELTNMVATVGENMSLRRVAHLSVTQGIIASYVHNSLTKNLGKIGVLVALESSGNSQRLMEVGRQIAMHVAAAKPEALDITSVDPAALDRERNILTEQAQGSGKPADIIAKMVEGRLRKYYEEVVLLEQPFVVDPEKRVKQIVEALAKELGTPVTLKGFVRYALGEGIEREQKDFASEVAAAIKTG